MSQEPQKQPVQSRRGWNFFHQLHHRFFECNYGTWETPWDKWFGTFHDGTDAGDAQMLARMRASR